MKKVILKILRQQYPDKYEELHEQSANLISKLLTDMGQISNESTIRVFSDYQIEHLKDIFLNHTVEKIARVDETGLLMVRYREGVNLEDTEGYLKTISIPQYES